VLYVGSLFTRRRIPELLQAFAIARERVPGARLVLVGDNRTSPRIDPGAIAASLGIDRDVDWREYVTDDDLNALYDRARVFAFLSDYEGFGMTPLEAMAHGVPAVVLDSAVAREVYGDAARLVPPEPPIIANALTELLADTRAHAALVSSGAARLARYSWTASAAAVMRTLEDAAARR
jgi:glycosyltransferase involved in cell wall biosynthesis